jgi:hypothetical protein
MVSTVTTPKTKSLTKFGVLGLLSLVAPWYIIQFPFAYRQQYVLSWHFIIWFVPNTAGPYGYSSFVDLGQWILGYPDFAIALGCIGFISVTVGSLFLVARKRVGGILLIADALLCLIFFVWSWIFAHEPVVIPVGAFISGIVGAYAYFKRAFVP